MTNFNHLKQSAKVAVIAASLIAGYTTLVSDRFFMLTSIALNEFPEREALQNLRITGQLVSICLNFHVSCPSFGVLEHVKMNMRHGDDPCDALGLATSFLACGL
jgi:hypothetical protein